MESLILLENLSLNDNGLKKLPDSIGQLSNLKYLSIYNNRKLTNFPESIANLENLEFLSISSNSLDDLPDLSNLSKLDTLELYDNKLKLFSENIASADNLKSSNLNNNFVNDSFVKDNSKRALDFLLSLSNTMDNPDESDSSTSNISNQNNTSIFLQVNGYGVETFAGTVEAATYQYFEDNDIDLEDYSNDAEWGDDNCQVPRSITLVGVDYMKSIIYGMSTALI